jgi:hypothetical protein
MRCNNSPRKNRVSRTHNGSGHPYKHGMKSHTWIVEGNIRRCKCGKTIKRLSERKQNVS